MNLLVTGSSGRIGSEVCAHFARLGWMIHGLDNNQRAVFFGSSGDTRWNQDRLAEKLGAAFCHHEVDIRNRTALRDVVQKVNPQAIIHAAAQPSVDRATEMTFETFDTNAVGTLNLLEAARQACREAPFVHLSSSRVYGDGPNTRPLRELETRWDFAEPDMADGIDESFPIDQCRHSLYGASKTAADIMVQEYGRYFGLPTCCLRLDCITEPKYSGVDWQGRLSLLVRTNLECRPFKMYGLNGKQVWDNIHVRDVAAFMAEFIAAPRAGEVYNLGGGRANSCSAWEAFQLAGKYSRRAPVYNYEEKSRPGDPVVYIANSAKARAHYPAWDITVSLEDMIRQLVEAHPRILQFV
jgi:CDP-paratose 2-epimerase